MIIKLIFITLQQSETTKKHIHSYMQSSCYYILYTHIDKHHPH